MNASRTVMWMVGVIVILAGAYLVYFEAGLDRWISLGVLAAGILLFVGLAAISFASGSPSDPSPAAPSNAPAPVAERGPTVVVEQPSTVVVEQPPNIVVDRRPIYVEERRYL